MRMKYDALDRLTTTVRFIFSSDQQGWDSPSTTIIFVDVNESFQLEKWKSKSNIVEF